MLEQLCINESSLCLHVEPLSLSFFHFPIQFHITRLNRLSSFTHWPLTHVTCPGFTSSGPEDTQLRKYARRESRCHTKEEMISQHALFVFASNLAKARRRSSGDHVRINASLEYLARFYCIIVDHARYHPSFTNDGVGLQARVPCKPAPGPGTTANE